MIYLLFFPGFFYFADSKITYYTSNVSDTPDYDGLISIWTDDDIIGTSTEDVLVSTVIVDGTQFKLFIPYTSFKNACARVCLPDPLLPINIKWHIF